MRWLIFCRDQKVSPETERRWRIFALGVWAVVALVITIMVALNPEKRTVTHLYHAAVERWQAHSPLYDGPSGMNYLPSFVPIFAPFHFLSRTLGDVVWRWFAMSGLAFGLGWIARTERPDLRWRTFAALTLLALPLSLGAVRNGQANAHMGVLFLLTAVALATQRWSVACLLVGLAVAIKPLGLAAAGLVFMAFPALWWRLAISVPAFLLLPWLMGPGDYVQGQYADALKNLRECASISEHRFADLNGLFRTFGAELTGRPATFVRLMACAVFAAVCFVGVRRLPLLERSFGWLAAAAGFLMLFNPMNEANSYVMLAPVLAFWVWRFGSTGEPALAWLLVFMLLSMSLLPNLVRPWLGNSFALAWHPLMTMVFLGVLLVKRSSLVIPVPNPSPQSA